MKQGRVIKDQEAKDQEAEAARQAIASIMLSKNERIRYQRQMMMPEIGESGQRHLKAARVMIAGMGGLGTVAATYLAAAGVGRLVLADRDTVATADLNRQILYTTDDLDQPKVTSARRRLYGLNPHCEVEEAQTQMGAHNLGALASNCNLIVDATDNLATRRQLNQVAAEMEIPLIYGGINGFGGMVGIFIPGQTACLECVFGEMVGSTGTIPVLGVVPGIVASLQAQEAVKHLVGAKGTLAGKLLYFNGLDLDFRQIQLVKNPRCSVCGDGGA